MCVLEMTVKPSAQPSMVRIHHLPPPKLPVRAGFCVIAATRVGAVCQTAGVSGVARFLQVSAPERRADRARFLRRGEYGRSFQAFCMPPAWQGHAPEHAPSKDGDRGGWRPAMVRQQVDGEHLAYAAINCRRCRLQQMRALGQRWDFES